MALRQEVVRVLHRGGRIEAAITRGSDGVETRWDAEWFISSIPLTRLVLQMDPPAPEAVQAAARSLTFRHLLTVDLVVDHPDLFPDNWIYIHDNRLKVGRIQNFKNWSPHMVPDPSRTSLGLEYFCFSEDALWQSSDADLVALATREMELTGLLKGAQVVDGTVVRVPMAYPVYRTGYEAHLETVSAWLKQFENLQPVGRYGMFKYNNADHSILTALLAVENQSGARHDIWSVNTDTEYHEVRKG